MGGKFARIPWIAVLLLALVVMAACGRDAGDEGATPPATGTQEGEGSEREGSASAGGATDRGPGGETSRIVVASPQEPQTLLPHFDLLSATHEVLYLTHDCLYYVNVEGDYVPALATEVPTVDNGLIRDGGRTYEIPLHPEATWHDGEPVTSADVRYTWQVIMDENLPIPSRSGWDQIADIETPDPHTAIFRFDEPNVSLLQTLSTGSCALLPRHTLEGTDLMASPQHREPLGNGPYRVVEWSAGSHIRLEANPDYWQEGRPRTREIVYRIIASTEGMRAALERGDVHVQLYPSVADQQFVRQLNGYDLAEVPTYSWWFFWLNNEHPALADARVRRALEHAVDKQAIADSVFRGDVGPLWAALPPAHWAYNPNVEQHPYDPAQAEALLEEAGWTPGAGGIRQKDGTPLQLEILNIAGEQERLQVVQIVQQYWQQVGIDVGIRQIDAASFPPTMADGDWDVAYGRFGEQHEPTFSLWLGTNWQRYRNDQALDLARQSLTVVDREQRREMLQRFQALVAEDTPVIFIVPRVAYSAYDLRLEGFAPSLTGSLWNADTWVLR